MGNSLQDQLLQAGLVDEKAARKAGKGKGKPNKLPKKERKAALAPLAQPPQDRAQVARDRELNRQQQQQREQRAVAAQIRQLIETHRLSDYAGDLGYHFVLEGAVKRIHVNPETHLRLVAGRLAIAPLDKHFELLPREIGEKIAERDASKVVLIDSPTTQVAEDDPYAAFVVPDDLMW